MAFAYIREDADMGKLFILKQRTFVVTDGSRIMGPEDRQGKLLGPAGAAIPLEQAARLGLIGGASEKKEAAPIEDKGLKPAADKSAKRKGR